MTLPGLLAIVLWACERTVVEGNPPRAGSASTGVGSALVADTGDTSDLVDTAAATALFRFTNSTGERLFSGYYTVDSWTTSLVPVEPGGVEDWSVEPDGYWFVFTDYELQDCWQTVELHATAGEVREFDVTSLPYPISPASEFPRIRCEM